MKGLLLIIVITGYFHSLITAQSQPAPEPVTEIFMQIEIPGGYNQDSLEMEIGPVQFIGGEQEKDTVRLKIKDGRTIVRLNRNEPVHIVSLSMRGIFEPGDSVYIRFAGEVPIYSGRGAEKFRVLDTFAARIRILKKPANPYTLHSINDYWEWSRYFDEQVRIAETLFHIYKDSVSSYAFNYLKANLLSIIENERFSRFIRMHFKASELGIHDTMLNRIYDSIYLLPQSNWLRSLQERQGNIHYFYNVVQLTLKRQYNFDLSHPIVSNEVERKQAYYKIAEQLFRGHTLENYLVYLLTENGMKELGFIPAIEKMLSNFYARPDYPEYKEYVRKYEATTRAFFVKKGRRIPELQWPSNNNKIIAGKIVVMNFWDSQLQSGQTKFLLDRLRRLVAEDTNVIFFDEVIKTDAISQAIAKKFNVKTYPAIYIWDINGRFLTDPLIKPGGDKYDEIMQVIRTSQVRLQDGPYVLRSDSDLAIAYTLYGRSLSTMALDKKERIVSTATDEYGKRFRIVLKPSHAIEPDEYEQPEKLLALSDIEGNFDAFRKLLQANNVIDENFNWTFGKGHLVFAGDMFDRGDQVTECLWLIYSLEEKAKAQGGYVHFILGNHEIMNLSGDTRYVREKYLATAKLLEMPYMQLYNKDSELGNWLRTKNIIEKIGDILFVHGGISAEVAKLPLTMTEMNRLARSHYDKQNIAAKSADSSLSYLYHPRLSPFWHRAYYQEEEIKVTIHSGGRLDTTYKTTKGELNTVLEKFNVRQIVTGHTVISDTISVHNEGRIINTDVRHARGPEASNALLIIGGNEYFRVDQQGRRVRLRGIPE